MSDKKLKVNAHLSVGRRKSSVVARRIVFLFLSLVFSISVILAVIFLVNIAGITQSNLHDTAELTMRYLNIDVQNAILPAMEVTKIAASIAPNLDYSEISPYFLEMMNVVPAVGELYYGTTLSRFDGGIFITATGVDVYGMYPEWDQVTRDWMTHAVKQPDDLVFIDPYVDTATGQLCITMSKAVIDNSKIIGVVGTDVFLDVLTQIVTSRKITSDGNTFIIDKDGLILVHEEQENVLTNNFFEGKNKDFCDKFLSGLQVTVIGNTYWASMPVTGLDWIMVTTGSTEEFDSDFWHILRLVIILAIVVAVISSVVAVLFSRSLVNPIIQLFSVLKAISTGDFTQHIEAKNKKDEVSQMTMLLKETQEGIKNLIIRIKKEAENLSLIGNDLASDMNQTATAMNEITTNVKNIKARILNQSASVSETHSTMKKLVEFINKLNKHVENQSNNISSASSSIEEITANIQSVSSTLIVNAANVDALSQASEVGRSGLHEVASDIREIARESEGLLEINSVMQNIASQTNLLSMNAAIEAAHAGEAGKGFAVVADEIRKLAVNSSQQSTTIGNVLKKIKDSIDKITRSTGNVLNKFELIDNDIKTVASQEINIRSVMEKQDAGGKHILKGVSELNGITRDVKNGSIEMLEGATEVIKESENLERVTEEIKTGMNEMTDGTEYINKAVTHAYEISKENRQAIDKLIKGVSQFKVE